MKGKFFTLLIFLGIFPILAVGGIGLYVMLKPGGAVPGSSHPAALAPPNIDASITNAQGAAENFVKLLRSTAMDFPSLADKSSPADFQAFVTAHPGLSDLFQVNASGLPMQAYPVDPAPVDAAYSTSEEFQNVLKHFTDTNSGAFQFYSRRNNRPSFVFIQKSVSGGFLGVDIGLEGVLKPLVAQGGDASLIDFESGKVYGSTRPDLLDKTLSGEGDSQLASVLQDLKTNKSGSSSNQDRAVVYAPLNMGHFAILVQFPLRAPAGSAAAIPAAEGLTLDKVMKDPAALLENHLFLAILGALGWVLLVGFMLLMGFLSPLKSALKVLESAAAGQGKISEEALRKVGAPEVTALLATSARWAERLDREKEDLGRQKDDEIRKAMAQLQQRNQELVEAGKKVGDAKADGEQKAQQLADKLKELDALKGMADGLRNQGEQARGEIAKLKTLMANQDSEAKKVEADLKKKMEEQATHAVGQVRELESKLLQVVAATNTINVSQVRVAAIKTMAEELKTTLGIIKGYVSSALGSPQGGITEKQQEFLGMVINRSARLEKFINDLVDIYQVEIEQDGAQRDPASLASEIEGLAFNFQPQADIKGIKIKVEEKGTPSKVPIVRRRFTQLWNILYLQIIKDAPRNAQVTIVVEPVGQDVKVTVLDPGLIVKPEFLPKLFDDFYDPKHPASPQLAGTGLKFALIKTILSAHGGVALAEKAEPGTRLLLTFPSEYKKKENPAEAILASVRKAVPPVTGGLLGAVKPGTMAPSAPTTPPAPGLPTAPGKPAAAPLGVPPGPGAVKPPLPLGGGLDALMGGPKPAPPTAPVPKPLGMGGPGAMPPPLAPKPALPGAPPSPSVPKAPIPAGGLDALLGGGAKPPAVPPIPPKPSVPSSPMSGPPPAAPKPPVPGVPGVPISGPPPAVPKPPMAGGGMDALLSAKPPVPPPPAVPKPPTPPIPAPPPPGAGAPPPKIVPTGLKPAVPPGILDLETQDGFKMDASKPPAPPKPAGSGPSVPPPPPKPSGAPIVKDLEKDSGGGSGDLIE